MDQSSAHVGQVIASAKRHLWHPLLQHSLLEHQDPTLFERAQGAYVIDSTGREYLDAMSGLFCVNIGYGRKEVADAVYRQMRQLPYYPLTQLHEPAARLAEMVTALLPPGLERVFFTNSGSEAVETALKIARQAARQRHPGENRYKIVARYRGYHGFTMGALSATGQPMRKTRFEPLVPGFIHAQPPDCYRCPFGRAYPSCGVECVDQFETIIQGEGPETVAAVIAEPVIGGGGIITPPDEYFPRLRTICDRYGVFLILDEVITGFGRLGTHFGCQTFNVVPDMITVAKGITSAYAPLGACIASSKVFDAFYGKPDEVLEFLQVSTFGGHPVSCAAGVANLEIFTRERLWENAREVGAYLMGALKPLEGKHLVGNVRGKGLLVGLEIVDNGKIPATNRQMAELMGRIKGRGVLAGRNTYTVSGFTNVLILSPPLIIGRKEADAIVSAVEESLREVEALPPA